MLPVLLEVPRTAEDWLRWGWNHSADHREIIQAASNQGANLTNYVLYPIIMEDIAGFLTRHQQTHIDMDAAAGVQSTNLLGVDFNDERQLAAWISSNYQEHFDVRAKFGI